MKYYTTQSGAFLIVGLVGPDSEEILTLAENIFDVFTCDDVFHGRANFLSKNQFMKFLIYKELFMHKVTLKVAAQRARKILENDVVSNAFLSQLPKSRILDDYRI